MRWPGRKVARGLEDKVTKQVVQYLIAALDAGEGQLLAVELGSEVSGEDGRLVAREGFVMLLRLGQAGQFLAVADGEQVLDGGGLGQLQAIPNDNSIPRQTYLDGALVNTETDRMRLHSSGQ